MRRLSPFVAVFALLVHAFVWASSEPLRGRSGMVVSQKMLASEAGLQVLEAGGNAVDAAVATALALAVALPRAGNIGGGGPLSSMTPTVVARDGELFMVTGSPGGRTIINTVLQSILHAVDHGLNAQEVIDAGRIHHQWLPDHIRYEAHTLSPDTLDLLRAKGHALEPVESIGCAQVINYNRDEDILEGGSDLRRRDGGVATY